MNEKFVVTNQFIFLEQPAQFIFKSPSTQQIPVIIIMDTISQSHKRWMDGWTQRQGWTNRHIERQIE